MSVELPDAAAEWPFEARHLAIAEKHTTADIRGEIVNIVGAGVVSMPDADKAGAFTKSELAAILMALGGPQEAGR